MAGLYDTQAEIYAQKRPKYPKEWFSMLASLTPAHSLAWDAGTGTGQSAISVAELYDQVIATDVSSPQLNNAAAHPKVRYLHTPVSTTEDSLVSMIGGESSVDLITAASAVHWFDLPSFYSVANRVLKKPHGIIAVWSYSYDISPLENSMKLVFEAARPYTDPRPMYALEGRYKTLPFPFESVGLGSEGKPIDLDMELELSFDDFLGFLRTGSPIAKAKAKGVDLLSPEIVREIEKDWGEDKGNKRLVYKAFMLVGKPKC